MADEHSSRRTDFERDLASLVESRREGLGPPPSEEELRALRAGTLPEADAERLRERLAADPAWAEAYLEMEREPDEEELADLAELARDAQIDVDAAWRRVEAGLATSTSPGSRVGSEAPAAPAPRRSPAAWLLPLAAVLLVALGAAWWWQTAAAVHEVWLLAEARGGEVSIPGSAERVELVVDVAALGLEGRYALDLRSSQAVEPVATGEAELEPGRSEVRLRVERQKLRDGLVYRLEARRLPDGDEAVILASFRALTGDP